MKMKYETISTDIHILYDDTLKVGSIIDGKLKWNAYVKPSVEDLRMIINLIDLYEK